MSESKQIARECTFESCPFGLPHPHSINDHPTAPTERYCKRCGMPENQHGPRPDPNVDDGFGGETSKWWHPFEPAQPAAPPQQDVTKIASEFWHTGLEAGMKAAAALSPPADAEQRARANHCPTCGAFPVDIAAATAATPPDAEQRARERAETLVDKWCADRRLLDQRFITTQDVRILKEWIATALIAAALPSPDAQRIKDEVWEEAARIAEKPRVVFGTPLTAMQELAQDIAVEIRAKKGTQ